MPTGPKGQKRPADVIGNAIMIAQIETGETEDEVNDDDSAVTTVKDLLPSAHIVSAMIPPSLSDAQLRSIAKDERNSESGAAEGILAARQEAIERATMEIATAYGIESTGVSIKVSITSKNKF